MPPEDSHTKATAPAQSVGISARTRISPFFEATRRWGCRAYGVYNHMYMPVSYGDSHGYDYRHHNAFCDGDCDRDGDGNSYGDGDADGRSSGLDPDSMPPTSLLEMIENSAPDFGLRADRTSLPAELRHRER